MAKQTSAAAKKNAAKKRVRKNVERGQAHIQSSFNNTIVTLTDSQGNALSWASAGGLGFRGSKKSTPYAAQMAAETAYQGWIDSWTESSRCICKGTWFRKRSRSAHLTPMVLEIISITDVTPVL